MTLASRAQRLAQRSVKLGRVVRDPLYRRGLRHGVAASIEHEHVPFGAEFSLVVDVGANRGQFALFAARRFPHARLICFEPLPGARAVLGQLLDARPRTEVHGVALADRSGTADLHVARRDDSSSLLAITAAQVTAYPGTEEVDRLAVHTARLDEMLARPGADEQALLKIDVQGGELQVLAGAEGVLSGFMEVLMECSFVELYAGQATVDTMVGHLRDHGFGLAAITGIGRDTENRPVQADLLFRRCDRTARAEAG